jgi:hypothetical protein
MVLEKRICAEPRDSGSPRGHVRYSSRRRTASAWRLIKGLSSIEPNDASDELDADERGAADWPPHLGYGFQKTIIPSSHRYRLRPTKGCRRKR